MLTRQNVFEVSREAFRLTRLERNVSSRTFRRFLSRLVAYDSIVQCFAFDEGFSATQLKAIAEYARTVAADQAPLLPPDVVKPSVSVFDSAFGLVTNSHWVTFDYRTASLAQLRQMTEVVLVLADAMSNFADSPNDTALIDCTPLYVYRNLPCSIAPDDQLWVVSGQDVQGSGGVLEWCFDQVDAEEVLAEMKRFPERFKNLAAQPWASTQLEPQAA